MTPPAPQPDTLLAWMDALADPARLRLLRLLDGRELGVADLCDVLQMPQSTVSRHLKLLLERGLLRSRRHATNHLYELVTDELPPPARGLWEVARGQTEGWATAAHDALRLGAVLARRQEDPQAFFAGAAADWERIRGELYGQRFDLRAILPLLPSHYTVADLGCGAADLSALLAPHVARVIGVDASADMLKAARRRLDAAPPAAAARVDLRRGDLAALPVADAECDAALMLLALTYVEHPPAAVAEMARILRPGGTAVVVDLLRHDRDDFRRRLGQKHPGFSAAQLEAVFAAAGLAGVTTTPLPPDPAAKGPALLLVTGTRPQ